MSHGSHPLAPLAPRSDLYQGPFGRLFPDLAAWEPPRDAVPDRTHGQPLGNEESDGLFLDLARTMEEEPGASAADVQGDAEVRDRLETTFASHTPAGYTYFGQFVDHDITFDPASSLVRQNDPNGLLNFRTPRLDLDNVYGRGPSEQPYLYDQHDKGKLLLGEVVDDRDEDQKLFDLPRNSQGRALLGDMRNDENSMVSQLQVAFLAAHNTLFDRARDAGASRDEAFQQARQSLRWLYQWIVWHDFLGRVLDPTVHRAALRRERGQRGRIVWESAYDDVYRWKHQPFMPVEFSVAAYRFGHSMVRNGYRTNIERGFSPADAVPIFSRTGAADDDLRGFAPLRRANAVQWDWFLEMTSSIGDFPQRARKIDTKMANALSSLHEEDDAGHNNNVLAFRNLKRGWRFGLPSGTAMARALDVEEIPLDNGMEDHPWFYVLKEAEVSRNGESLGTLGSIIVGATFAGLLLGDPNSWINQWPSWTPNDDPLLNTDAAHLDNQDDESWSLASIIRIAGVPVEAGTPFKP